MINSLKQAALLVGLLLALIGCAPVVKDGQPAVLDDRSVLLASGKSVGQTFVARDRGLSGGEVFLVPAASGSGRIDLHLRETPTSSSDLATANLAVRDVGSPGFYSFEFPSQSGSLNHYYYLELDLEGDGQVRVATTAGDTYLDGALYEDGKPIDSQMSFRLRYDAVALALGLLGQAGSWLWAMVIALFLYVLPGWSLLVLLLPSSIRFLWAEKLGLAIGSSLALYPLLFLWTDLLGLHLGPLYAWLPGFFAIAFLLWRSLRVPLKRIPRWRDWSKVHDVGPDLALVVVIALVFFTRFWVIRSLDVPMWGDSYQHTLIAQLLVDHGGLFNSWQPYADLQTLTYHFGFHAAVAVFHWISGQDLPLSALWTGQILNALAVVALYPLAVQVGGNRWAGVAGVLIAGLLGSMPMYYLNWGRYTQLAGQAILPGAICLGWIALDARRREWGIIVLSWIIWAGLALTHLRVLIFAIFFFGAIWLLELRRTRLLFSRTLLLGIGSGLLFVPWFIHAFAGQIIATFAAQLTTPADAVSAWMQEYNAIGGLSVYLPEWLWVLIPLSVVWALWQRKRGAAVVAVWWGLILLAANPGLLHLPGQGALNNFSVLIAMYIPASLLVGSGLGWLAEAGSLQPFRWVQALLLLIVVGIGIWGANQRLGDLAVDQSALVTKPDLLAAAWIEKNTPPDARFLVNSFFAYGGSVIVGSDGGWWLPLLSHRQTTLPPLTYAAERGPRPDYREWINALTAQIRDKKITDPETIALLQARGIKYIYVGQRQGKVNSPDPALLQPDQLLASSFFRPVYNQDRTWVFQVVP